MFLTKFKWKPIIATCFLLILISCIAKPHTPEDRAKQNDLTRLNLNGPVQSVLIQMDIRGIGKHKMAYFEFNPEGYKTLEEHYNNRGDLIRKVQYGYREKTQDLMSIKNYLLEKEQWEKAKTISILKRDLYSDLKFFQNDFPDTKNYRHRLEKDEFGNLKEIEYLRLQQYSGYHIKIEKTEFRHYDYYGENKEEDPPLLEPDRFQSQSTLE